MPARTSSPRAPYESAFGPALLAWYSRHRRPLPWRADRSPYRIWVAEVILQQTRVAQAVPYYERFVREFPTIGSLAAAPIGRVLRVWQGAGYYARARNLHSAAQLLVRDRSGELPRNAEELERLPGVGPYIARAVAALAFGERTIALEANGLRVGARWRLARGDVRKGAARERVEAALERAMGASPPGEFNEAIMELGETVCLPFAPRCKECPVAFACRAYRELPDPAAIPSPRRARVRPHVRGAVVILEDAHGRWFVQRRPPRGLLGGLWEFPGGKIRPDEPPSHAAARELQEETGARARSLAHLGVVRHAYSHFTVELHVYRGRARSPLPRTRDDRRWVTRDELERLPIPKATEKAIALLPHPSRGRASPGSGSRPGRTHA